MTSVNRPFSAPDQHEFHQALSRGAGAWYAACLRITGNPALAQDAVQDALLNAWSKRKQFKGGARLETWIHRIAVNSALALIRRKRPNAPVEFADLPAEDAGPAERLAEQELGRDLEAAMHSLSEMERLCFILKHLEQWRLAEIAAELGTEVGPVKQALFRAVKKLRVRLPNLRREAC